MLFLCLAYGDEKDWKALLKEEQDALLAQDEVLRGQRRHDGVGASDPRARVGNQDAPMRRRPLPCAP